MVNRWHWVVITEDSVSGIPYEMSPECDGCRRSLPRSQVDSMTLGYQHHNIGREALEDLGLVTALVLVEAGMCALIHAHSDC